MTDDKTFDEIIKEEQAKLRQEERDAEDRLKEEREGVLRRSAARCYDALHQRFSAPDLTVESDFNESNGRIVRATAVLNGETATAASPASAAAPTQSASVLPFDFDSMPADTQRKILMIVAEPQRFRTDTIGDVEVLKDIRIPDAQAAARRKRIEEQSQQAGGDGTHSDPAPPAPAKKAAAKKAAPAPARSGATATEAEPPASAPAPQPAPAPDADTAAPSPADDETPESPSQPKASAMDRLKAAAKTSAAKLVEPTPK